MTADPERAIRDDVLADRLRSPALPGAAVQAAAVQRKLTFGNTAEHPSSVKPNAGSWQKLTFAKPELSGGNQSEAAAN